MTSKGGNALADFHGTAGPHGELLTNGSGEGERPLVEYRVGAGRVIFVGWRLADFTTATDAHRPNLERLFTNLLRYLASQNQNHARPIAPPGKSRYERRLGVPFLLADKPVTLTATVAGEKTAVVVNDDVQETAVTGTTVSVKALGLTLTQREKPVAQFVAQRRAEQDAMDRRDAELLKDVRVEKPSVKFVPAPLQPLEIPRADQSLLLGRSLYMAPGDGWGRLHSGLRAHRGRRFSDQRQPTPGQSLDYPWPEPDQHRGPSRLHDGHGWRRGRLRELGQE